MTFLENERLALRAILLSDATPAYLAWLNDPETTRGLEAGKFPSTLEELQTYIQHMQQDARTVMMAIVEKSSSLHIGNIKIHNFDWISRTCELGLMLGAKASHGKGYGYQACWLTINYAFQRLNMRKVWLAVYTNNPAAIKLYEKLGFQQEGCLKEHIFSGGTYHDKLFMSITSSQFK